MWINLKKLYFLYILLFKYNVMKNFFIFKNEFCIVTIEAL